LAVFAAQLAKADEEKVDFEAAEKDDLVLAIPCSFKFSLNLG